MSSGACAGFHFENKARSVVINTIETKKDENLVQYLMMNEIFSTGRQKFGQLVQTWLTIYVNKHDQTKDNKSLSSVKRYGHNSGNY